MMARPMEKGLKKVLDKGKRVPLVPPQAYHMLILLQVRRKHPINS